MKIFFYALVFIAPKIFWAQDTLLWSPNSINDPIHDLRVLCDPRPGLVFDGVYKDKKGIKAAYRDQKGSKFFVYKLDMTYVNYNIEVWSDSVVTIYYNGLNGDKCTLIFKVKSTPEELRKLFEGIPGHKGF